MLPTSCARIRSMTAEVERTAVDALAAKAGAAGKGYFGRQGDTHRRWNELMLRARNNSNTASSSNSSSSSSDNSKAPGGSRVRSTQQTPLVHRAYFFRSAAIERLVRRWLRETARERPLAAPRRRRRRRRRRWYGRW